MFQIFSQKKKGFSLVELLFVVAIIGILIGILVVVAGPARKQAKEARISNDLVELQNIAEQIYSEEGNYNNLDVGLSPQVSALQSDIISQGSSLTIHKSGTPATTVYCAYAYLPPSSVESFCVDYKGFAKKITNPETFCNSSGPFTCAP